MRPHPRIRKTIKWAGAALTVVLLVAWITSIWRSFGVSMPAGGDVSVRFGLLYISDPVFESGPYGWNWFWGLESPYNPYPFQWTIYRGTHGPIKSTRFMADGSEIITYMPNQPGRMWDEIGIPIWWLWSCTLVPTLFAWSFDAMARRRARMNLCHKCHYDRTGLAAGAVCPECGTGSGTA